MAFFTIIEIEEPPSIIPYSKLIDYVKLSEYPLKVKITPDETGLKSAVYSINGADPIALTPVEGEDYTHTAILTLQDTHNTVIVTATDNEDESRIKSFSIYRIPDSRLRQKKRMQMIFAYEQMKKRK